MKTKKLLILILVLTLVVSYFQVTVAAAETKNGIQPRFSNVITCTTTFNISSTGLASIYFEYTGKADVITSTKSEIYLEKRFLGIFWTRVDIGTTDDVWIDMFYQEDGDIRHTLQLEKTGTYRAKFKITFTGTNTADDVVERTIEATYG